VVAERHLHRQRWTTPVFQSWPDEATGRRVDVRIVVVGVLATSLLAWRGEMLRAMVSRGHAVLALAPEDNPDVRAALEAMGASFATVPMQRTGLDPLRDIATLTSLVRAMRRSRADVVFVYAAKPVVYGLIAARLAGVPLRVAMITGAGSAFGGGRGFRRRLLSWLVRELYRVALHQAHIVFFHNPDDERLFRSLGLVGARHDVVRINGSGIDLDYFSVVPLPSEPITFLMMARLIRDKGVREYVEAARQVRAIYPHARFQLLGSLDSNPSAISPAQLEAWQREGAIEYLGSTSDVRPFLARAHICVLPSYGEGMPRSVLEALAMGRPVLTTDVPGCRETVEPGRNGFLVAAGDADALARAMLQMLAEPGDVARMGRQSRLIAEERFNVHDVNRTILVAMGIA
jgi:glycosyltransferase involved in cell wall biosynthesis